ncbi:MAG: O-antigen ligase family protein [Anaerolineae bacterium]
MTEGRIWDQHWFPFAQLSWVTVAGGVWYLFPQLGPLPLLVGLLPWLARLVGTGHAGRRTPFDVALLVFLVTAVVSLWAAYDPDGSRAVFGRLVGRRKLWGLMLGVLIYYALAEFKTERQQWWLLVLLAGFGTAVALWFIATNDWDANPALWGPIGRLGRAIQSVLPHVPGDRLNPNVAGGFIALVLPMGLGLVAGAGRGRGTDGATTGPEATRIGVGWAAWGLASTFAMGLGLLLSSSRGALLGLGGAFCLAGAWWLAGRLRGGVQRLTIFAALVVAGALFGVSVVAGIPFVRTMILESEALANRFSIYYQAAHLVRDYLFTGCGLGNFPFVHSTYVLLIHVPEIVFAHSTPLDVAVEQGMLGSVALTAVWIGAAWIGMRRLAQSSELPTGLVAGLLSLAVLGVHGTFDSTIYGSRAVLLFWMPVGLIVAASRGQRGGAAGEEGEPAQLPEHPSTEPRSGAWVRWAAVGSAGLVFAVLLALVWRPLAASWHANLGAVRQTLVELRAYDHRHFDDPTLDEVRQREDFSQAIASFEHAVALDPGQVTARTRLAQIALARREYDAALEHALAAWEHGYRDRVTRLVLGDALVAHGGVEEAAALVRGLERAEERLQGQAYARYQQNGDWLRAAHALRTLLVLDPDNERVRQAAERAEAQVRGE